MGESQRQLESVRSWTRELAGLRARARKGGLRIAGHESPLTELTDEALSACDSLLQQLAALQLERDRLRRELQAESKAWEHLFNVIPTPSALTDDSGLILSVNRAAGLFLNIGPERLKGRMLLIFAEDRAAFAALVHRLPVEKGSLRLTVTMRPRERKPVKATLSVMRAAPENSAVWLWFMVSTAAANATPALVAAPNDGSENLAVTPEIIDGQSVPCHRCGGRTWNGHHFSSDDCAESLDDEARVQQSRDSWGGK